MAFIKEDNSCINYHFIRFFRHFVQSRNKHCSLSTLMSYSFYAETIPVLQKALAWSTDKLVRTIEFSTLLRDERLEYLFWFDAARIDPNLSDWIHWYTEVYLGGKTR